MDLTTIENRAVTYRQVLRTSFKALIVDFARKQHATATWNATINNNQVSVLQLTKA